MHSVCYILSLSKYLPVLLKASMLKVPLTPVKLKYRKQKPEISKCEYSDSLRAIVSCHDNKLYLSRYHKTNKLSEYFANAPFTLQTVVPRLEVFISGGTSP